jgi:5,10-methylene-tetrahydrofolate dehydrogenase/methenyl tetrahydrofolate cyclohydrolase
MHFTNRGMASYPSNEIEFALHPPENLAVAATLQECKVPLKGGKVLIVGSSATEGPVRLLAGYLYDSGCDVRILHLASISGIAPAEEKRLLKGHLAEKASESFTINPEGDAVVTWTNIAGWLTKTRLKPGSVVIDMGYKFVGGRISGDCEFPSVSQTASIVTPVPGGVRNVVQMMILQNLMSLIQRKFDVSDADVKGRLQRRFGSKQQFKSTGSKRQPRP